MGKRSVRVVLVQALLRLSRSAGADFGAFFFGTTIDPSRLPESDDAVGAPKPNE